MTIQRQGLRAAAALLAASVSSALAQPPPADIELPEDRQTPAEETAAAFIKENVTKPVVGYVAGFTAPEGKTMGHAGAIVSGSSGTAQAKKEALEAAGVKVGKTPSETAALMREIIDGLG